MKKLLKITSCLLSFTLAGCFGPVAVKSPSLYTLTSHQKPLPVSSKHLQESLLVGNVNASPGYGSSSMLYTMVPYKLMSYADSSWVAPPAQMLLPLLSTTIRQMNVFQSVIPAPFSGFSNYTLNATLDTLQQEFFQPVSQVRMVVFVSMTENKTQKVVASQRFSALVPSPGNDAYAGVLAANTAAGEIADQIALFVKKTCQ
mgnify:CR=1 FL=1